MSSLYIHIPFCKTRCIYCGFYSTTYDSIQNDYVRSLCSEMDLRHDYLPSADINTIYLGGGTPSQLTPENLEKLFSYIYKVYNVAEDAEITMECNPDDITPDYASVLGSLPVNRVSMGAQTFSDERLKFIRRRHNAAEVHTAVDLLRRNGIGNISIDLMFGFPGETADSWHSDITEALKLDVEHISAYSLMFEEGTPLYKMLEDGKVEEADEELSLRMYEDLITTLTENGYEHYEISNFARHGRESQHNSAYWEDIPYIGLGAAAHSYNRKTRQWNVSDVKKYISSISAGEVPFESEEIDLFTAYNDAITTMLRMRNGIDLVRFKERFGIELHDYLLRNAKNSIAAGHLVNENNHLHLTRSGIFISNDVMSDLIYI